MSQEILYSVEEGIATITLNRPERMNALTHELEAELHRIFGRADAARAVRVIILTGAGRAFCAGYDQSTTDKSGARHTDPKGKSLSDFIEFWQRTDADRVALWTHMWRLGKPIIAAVNGWAMGGGFWYQLAADITIASDQAGFAQPQGPPISDTTILFRAPRRLETGQPLGAHRRPFRRAGGAAHRHGERGGAARSAHGGGARARETHLPRAGAVGAAQQGRYHDGHACLPRLFLPSARRSPQLP